MYILYHGIQHLSTQKMHFANFLFLSSHKESGEKFSPLSGIWDLPHPEAQPCH